MQAAIDVLAIPKFLKISAAVRAKAWEKNPPRPMPAFAEPRSSVDEISEAFKAQLDADYIAERDALSAFKRPGTKKAKAYAAALAAKKAKSAPPLAPIDRTGMRWGRKRNGKYDWVPDVVAPYLQGKGRGSGASLAATVGEDHAKKPAPRTGAVARERDASPRVSGSSPLRSTNKEENHAKVMALIKRPGGATLDEIALATGWLRHSASAYLSGIRKATGNPVPLAKATSTYSFQEGA